MDCMFASNGLAVDYFGTVKPCCTYRPDAAYRQRNQVKQIDFVNWHRSKDMVQLQQQLDQGQWPEGCVSCQAIEAQNRGDSIRLNGQNSYSHYGQQDITLEIRGGSVCNFACQTCWPQASSRVAQFYRQAGMPFAQPDDADWDFDLLLPVKDRLRDIVLLGGEPFYDRRCQQFLSWLNQNSLSTNLVIFTNGSVIDQDFIATYPGKLILVFSIDAIDTPSEYIRYGSVWPVVKDNYLWCRSQSNVETRVNITTSPYNYLYLDQLIAWLALDWPAVVSFGAASHNLNSDYMDESVFPLDVRANIIAKLQRAVGAINDADIEIMQQHNARNAIASIIANLSRQAYNSHKHQRLRDFVIKMDTAKGIRIEDYCPETAEYLSISPAKFDRVSL